MGQHQTSIGIKSIEKINWKGKKILDIGCGDGKLSLEVLRRTKANSLIGLDSDEKEIILAKKTKDHSVSFIVGDALNLPFENESFDAIFCNIAFQQFSDKEKSLKEMYRVLRKEGAVIMNFIEEKSEVLQEILKLLKDHFNISLDKKGSKMSKEEFNKLAEKEGFKIMESTSKMDTFYFADIDVFLSGYQQTIEAKTKRLSPEDKELLVKKLKEEFLPKKTKEGIPDSWHIVLVKLIK